MSEERQLRSLADSSDDVIWNCTSTGSEKGGNFKSLEKTDLSWMEGHYVGTKSGIGKDNKSLHQFQLLNCGDKSHLSKEVEEAGTIVSVWGNKVLDDQVSKIPQIGMFTRINYEGRKAGQSGRSYHNWKVAVDDADVINVGAPVAEQASASNEETAPTENGGTTPSEPKTEQQTVPSSTGEKAPWM